MVVGHCLHVIPNDVSVNHYNHLPCRGYECKRDPVVVLQSRQLLGTSSLPAMDQRGNLEQWQWIVVPPQHPLPSGKKQPIALKDAVHMPCQLMTTVPDLGVHQP